jgi:uncharacterized protein with NRDE domain
MCSIILNLTETGTFIAANRDELLARPWSAPGAHWPAYPGVIAGRDNSAGGTWMALNRHGVMAAVLNRHGTLGPAAGKRSRGELPLLGLDQSTAGQAAAKIIQTIDQAAYRAFNLVIADADAAFFIRAPGGEDLTVTRFSAGVTMLTAGEPNDVSEPRIARHLPKFQSKPWESWPALLADAAPPIVSALNIPPRNGYGTVCSSLLALQTNAPPAWLFAPGAPDETAFQAVKMT